MLDRAPRTAQEVRTVLAQAGLSLRKSLGQHYLVDPNLRDALIKDAAVEPGELVLEVGVGLGILTAGLLERGATVLGVELDAAVLALTRRLLQPDLLEPAPEGEAPAQLVARLLEAHRHPTAAAGETSRQRAHLVEANVLKRKQLSSEMTVWLDALRAAAPKASLRLVANLPYQIASPLLVSLLEWRPEGAGRDNVEATPPRGFDGVAAMVQAEVAQRLAAEPGSEMYGGLSVLCQAHATWRVTRRIPPSVFMPRPKVDSAFVRGTVHDPSAPFPLGLTRDQYATFKQLVQAAFQYRRKHLHKALTLGTPYPAETIEAALAAVGLDAKSRGETASPQAFADLARAVKGEPKG